MHEKKGTGIFFVRKSVKKIPVPFLLAASAWLAGAAPAFAESVTLFRVFLNDGTAIVSYGEYARVGDRLVFSMPIGAVDANTAGDPSLHVVNLPVSAVNWTATEKYAESARHTHYMTNSAESDYAALAGDVAATLNAIVLASDATARLNMAVAARRRLATWPRDHYGYRADDVKEMLGLLDEAISGLRVAAGESSFAIDLVATTPPRDPRDQVPMLRTPSAVESITHAIAAAKATDIAVDRVSILRSVIAAIDNSRNALSDGLGRTDPSLGTPHDRRRRANPEDIRRVVVYHVAARDRRRRPRRCARRGTSARDGGPPRRRAGAEAARRDQRAAGAGEGSTGCGSQAAAGARSMARTRLELSCV